MLWDDIAEAVMRHEATGEELQQYLCCCASSDEDEPYKAFAFGFVAGMMHSEKHGPLTMAQIDALKQVESGD